MSWFNRKPRPKNSPQVLGPKTSSPATERRMKEVKERVRTPKENADDK